MSGYLLAWITESQLGVTLIVIWVLGCVYLMARSQREYRRALRDFEDTQRVIRELSEGKRKAEAAIEAQIAMAVRHAETWCKEVDDTLKRQQSTVRSGRHVHLKDNCDQRAAVEYGDLKTLMETDRAPDYYELRVDAQWFVTCERHQHWDLMATIEDIGELFKSRRNAIGREPSIDYAMERPYVVEIMPHEAGVRGGRDLVLIARRRA